MPQDVGYEEAVEKMREDFRAQQSRGLSSWWLDGDVCLPSGALLKWVPEWELWSENLGDRLCALNERHRNSICDVLDAGLFDRPCLSSLLSVVDRSESPIEADLGIALLHACGMMRRNAKLGMRRVMQLEQQVEVSVDGEVIARLDFCLFSYLSDMSARGVISATPPDSVLAIECDGHDFHEKTKAQALRDKGRDRHLLSHGINTIRFVGSEIYRDPVACAGEAASLLVGLEERMAGSNGPLAGKV